jgi:56kDa selenium binding protein (SBP56)
MLRWGTGELRCYDVSEPMNPLLRDSVRLGGIASHAAHPKGGELNGGPQMLELSRQIEKTSGRHSTAVGLSALLTLRHRWKRRPRGPNGRLGIP